MSPTTMEAIRQALAAYQPGDLLALSDLHEALTQAVQTDGESPLVLDLQGCIQTIEGQLSGGSYELDELFFENIGRILDSGGAPNLGPIPVAPQSSSSIAAINPEYVQTFCIELGERLGNAQELILKLEAGRATEDDRNALFRIFHTIKGEAGFLKLTVLGGLVHSLETVLDGLRKGKVGVSPELIDHILEGVDCLEKAGQALTEGGSDLEAFRPAFERVGRSAEALLGGTPAETVAPLPEAKPVPTASLRSEESLIKVSGAKLAYLVDMVGEMLILQNQMADDSKEAQMLRKVSREVQQAAMSLRTVQVRPLFTKMQRAVRDVARQLGKTVTVDIQGGTAEIDRALIEAMEEPLLHLVRNSIGHGIEDAEARRTVGKPEEGRVTLSAERRGNHVIFGIEDDGRGLDPQAILRAAVQNGVVDQATGDTLSDEKIYELIFRDGLSTARQVDAISGRGVGMSIVKSTVDKFRGHIHIKTKTGSGTRFDLVFPLSMAILDGMIIELNTEKYILAVENVLEAVRIRDDMLVDVTGGGRVLRLRGDIVPAVDLTDFFYGRPAAGSPVAVIVENNRHDRFALLVENVLDKREVVIKSLGHRFDSLDGISAAAILRGGEIGYLIDIDAVSGGDHE